MVIFVGGMMLPLIFYSAFTFALHMIIYMLFGKNRGKCKSALTLSVSVNKVYSTLAVWGEALYPNIQTAQHLREHSYSDILFDHPFYCLKLYISLTIVRFEKGHLDFFVSTHQSKKRKHLHTVSIQNKPYIKYLNV